MSSKRFTKINMDVGVYGMLTTLAAAKGISAVELNERYVAQGIIDEAARSESE